MRRCDGAEQLGTVASASDRAGSNDWNVIMLDYSSCMPLHQPRELRRAGGLGLNWARWAAVLVRVISPEGMSISELGAGSHLVHFDRLLAVVPMATIHSLPQELLRQVLFFAYVDVWCPGNGWARTGLMDASLVHSSWRQPAQELLTYSLAFCGPTYDAEDEQIVWWGEFMRLGPARVRCHELRLEDVPLDWLEELLPRLEDGVVKRLCLDGELSVGLLTRAVFSGEPDGSGLRNRCSWVEG
jgi:hypothetical protein